MLEINQCYIGDCAVVLATFPDVCIDLTVTSPPYDNLRAGAYESKFDLETIARQLYRVTKPGGVVVWVVGDSVVDGSETTTSAEQKILFHQVGFNIHDTMIYYKTNPANPSTTRYHQQFEYMFVFSAGTPKTFNPIKDKKNIWAGLGPLGQKTVRGHDGKMSHRNKFVVADHGMRSNVWLMKTAAQENVCQPNLHPAIFPKALAHDHILSWSNPGDIVLDPFAGSGTTLEAALQLGRKYVGIEISAEYVNDIILPRLRGTTEPLPNLDARQS